MAPAVAAPTADRRRRRLWTTPYGSFSSRLDLRDGIAVVTLEGEVDSHVVVPCRSAMERAIRTRPGHLVIDVSRATVGERSIGLLSLMLRAAARSGLDTQFTGLPLPVRSELARIAEAVPPSAPPAGPPGRED